MNSVFKKIICTLCVAALIFSAVYIPVVLNVNAATSIKVTEGETVLFDFNDSVGRNTSADNKKEYENTGIGLLGWGGTIDVSVDDPDNKVLLYNVSKVQTWATFGASRLHKKVGNEYQVYYLEPDSQYVVSLDVRTISSSQFTDDVKTPHECYISMGYGTYKTGTDANYVSNMSKTLVKIVSTKAESGVYTLATDMTNKKQLNCSNDWQTVTYVFTTPSDLGQYDHALAFYATNRTGFRAEIDNVKVTKLGESTGAVLLVDDYSGTTDVILGNVGDKIALPDITDRATDAKHKFIGWYTDEAYSESVESFEIVKGVTSIYSNWSKPVKITFLNTLDNSSAVIEGMAGDDLTMPERPFDKNNSAWFLGWYTDQTYSLEFTNEKFGYSDMTLFSLWQTEIAEIHQDFEKYEKDVWEPKDREKGDYTFKDKSNSYYFAKCFSKEQGISDGEGNYAIKLHWDPTQVKDISKSDGVNINVPEAYDSATKYNANDNVIYLDSENLQNLHEYKVSFKYKVIKAETDVNFFAASAVRYNIYSGAVNSKQYHLKLNSSDEWKEFSFTFTTNFASDNAKGIFLGVTMDKNAEVIMYIDDVSVESMTLPAEALITLVKNNGEENEVIKGLKGKNLSLPTPKHIDNATFMGWYVDAKFNEPFTQNVCPEENVMLYAKWSNAAISFKSYTFDTANNGKLVTIENKKGAGKDDDFAASWKFDGSAVYQTAEESSSGEKILWATRGNQKDHVLKIAEGLENGVVYRVSFDYKVSDSTNVNTTITPVSAHRSNIYLSACYNAYSVNTISVPSGGIDWTKAEYCFVADVKQSSVYVGDSLYLTFKTIDNSEENKAEIYVDNVLVEKVEAPYIFFDCQNEENVILVKGEAGEKINLPAVPKKFGYDFTGWFTDIECKNKFEKATFDADTEITVYAGWKAKSVVKTSFENYRLTALGDCVVDNKTAASGKYSARFGNRTEGNYRSLSYVAIGDGNVPFNVEVGEKYVVTFKYRINKEGTTDLSLDLVSGSLTNFWVSYTNKLFLSDTEKITTGNQQVLKGKWMTMSMLVDTKAISEANTLSYTVLYLMIRGFADGDISIDDVTIAKIPGGKSAVIIDNGGSNDVPDYLLGSKNSNFYNKLPQNPTVTDRHFIGYYVKDGNGKFFELEQEKALFGAANDKPVKVYARFIDKTVTENFEDGEYVKTADEYANAYTIYDFDYEIYDSEAVGNSEDNVTSGRYSLHRKGENEFFENAVLLIFKNQIAEGQRYTVKFKVKMGEHLHTDGAIKIASGRSWFYSWTTTGEYYPVVAIKDLADGNWHEISYTFNAVEPFAVIQTPGYVDLYMDDFEFTLVDKSTPLSVPATFTEYVPVQRNADGSVVEKGSGPIDVTTIIDNSIYEKDFDIIWVVVPCAAFAIIIIAVLIVFKKKKKKA